MGFIVRILFFFGFEGPSARGPQQRQQPPQPALQQYQKEMLEDRPGRWQQQRRAETRGQRGQRAEPGVVLDNDKTHTLLIHWPPHFRKKKNRRGGSGRRAGWAENAQMPANGLRGNGKLRRAPYRVRASANFYLFATGPPGNYKGFAGTSSGSEQRAATAAAAAAGQPVAGTAKAAAGATTTRTGAEEAAKQTGTLTNNLKANCSGSQCAPLPPTFAPWRNPRRPGFR